MGNCKIQQVLHRAAIAHDQVVVVLQRAYGDHGVDERELRPGDVPHAPYGMEPDDDMYDDDRDRGAVSVFHA